MRRLPILFAAVAITCYTSQDMNNKACQTTCIHHGYDSGRAQDASADPVCVCEHYDKFSSLSGQRIVLETKIIKKQPKMDEYP